MSSGQLFRAIQRTGGIAPAVQPLVDFFKKRQQEQEQKEYVNSLFNAYNNFRQGLEGDNTTTAPVSGNRPQPNMLAPKSTDVNTGGGNDIGFGFQPPNLNPNNVLNPSENSNPTGNVLAPTVKSNVGNNNVTANQNANTLSPEEKYRKAQDLLDKFFINSILKAPQGVNTQPANVLATILGNRVSGMKPKGLKFINTPPGGKTSALNLDTGTVSDIVTNPKKNIQKKSEYEMNPDGSFKIYKIGDQDWFKKIDYDSEGNKTGESLTRNPKQGEGQVNVNLPEVNIDNNVKQLTEYQGFYKYWEDVEKGIIKDTRFGPEEATNKKRLAMEEIKGITNALASQLNDKIPGFEGVMNLLYQRVGNNADRIDPEVEKTLKGKSPDTIRWMKMILHSRIFGALPSGENINSEDPLGIR